MLTYNNAIQVFPAVLIAGAVRLHRREFFEIEDAADREVPTVSFQPDAPPPPRLRHPPAMRPFRRARSALLAAALARARSRGRRRGEVVLAAAGRRRGAGRRERQPPRRRAHHLRVQRAVQRRLPRHPAAPGRVDRPTSRSARAGGLPAGRLHGARLRRRARHLRRRHVGGRVRIVWHYQASDELRTFSVRYRLHGPRRRLRRRRRRQPAGLGLRVGGAARPAHGDGVRTRQGRCAPGAIRSTCAGDVQLAGEGASLRALNVPAGQFVELRTVIPRAAFTSTAGMRVVAGNGLQTIVAEETRRRGRVREGSASGSTTRSSIPWRYALILLLLGTIPAFLVVGVVFWFYGRERRPATTASTSRSRRPTPSRRSSPRCSARAARPGSFEFTATLFDLIRRGVYTSTPVTTERAIWGGLRKRERLRPRARGRASADVP